jgi:hypothetical protein
MHLRRIGRYSGTILPTLYEKTIKLKMQIGILRMPIDYTVFYHQHYGIVKDNR